MIVNGTAIPLIDTVVSVERESKCMNNIYSLHLPLLVLTVKIHDIPLYVPFNNTSKNVLRLLYFGRIGLFV